MNYSLRAHFRILSLVSVAMLISACQPPKQDSNSDSVAVNPPIIKKVTRETYLSGKAFCEKYSEITSKEHGKYITVPQDYANPAKGTLQIYAYTNKPFDPKKPSYIFVDGGPGQNTHGEMEDYLGERYNELRFDQRGLGCSAPDNYDVYKNSDLYSSDNVVQDMEMIRKAYGIQKWSVYGLSYGTVPATMYGSKYPDSTRSVVLEGVFGDPKKVHLLSYKLEKINLVIDSLNLAQKESFNQLLNEDSEDRDVILGVAFQLFYQDTGMRIFKMYLDILIENDGTIRRDLIQRVRESMDARENKYALPQQPGAVDENILNIIYCKNLDYRNKSKESLFFSPQKGFYVESESSESYAKVCDSVGVTPSKEQKFKLKDNVVNVPVYYFQGSHDAATMALGAVEHWKVVPQKQSYFLMAQKGGHNPNLSKLSAKSYSVRRAQADLMYKAMEAEPVALSDLNDINVAIPYDQIWKLYTEPKKSIDLGDLDGIDRIRPMTQIAPL